MYMTIAEKRKIAANLDVNYFKCVDFCTFTYSVNAGYSKLPFLEVIKSFLGWRMLGHNLL